jgi:hypothetical protein
VELAYQRQKTLLTLGRYRRAGANEPKTTPGAFFTPVVKRTKGNQCANSGAVIVK